MSEFIRFAIYYVPDAQPLADFGAAWLGWDVMRGCDVAHPDVPGIVAITQAPRKYGFHATLKPPFGLKMGRTRADLDDALQDFSARQAPVRLDGLELSHMGPFLALVPVGDTASLDALAAACVTNLDHFRAPARADDLDRRRAAGLSAIQDSHLVRWGYPYVLDQFRFHMTLTGALADDQLRLAQDHLQKLLPALPAPFVIKRIALVGQRADGFFRLIHAYTLSG